MLKHLERLKALKQEIADAGMIRKAELAGEVAEESYSLAVAMARKILTLEKEVQEWKSKQHPPR